MSIVSDIEENINDYLGLRDELGAIKESIFILTRTWDAEKGKGLPADEKVQVLPTPQLVDLTMSYRNREAGSDKQADVMLKMISKKTYPERQCIDCSTTDESIEKWYLIDGFTYEVVSVTQDYVWWNVYLKKTVKNKIDA